MKDRPKKKKNTDHKKRHTTEANEGPRPDVVVEGQLGSVFDKVPNDIMRKIFLQVDNESLLSTRLVSTQFNNAMKSDAFWKAYAEKYPLATITNMKMKKWLLLKYIQTGNHSILDYGFIWSLCKEDNLTFCEVMNGIGLNEKIRDRLYKYIQNIYSKDSSHAMGECSGMTILYWAICLNQPDDARFFLDTKVNLSENHRNKFSISSPQMRQKIYELFQRSVVFEYEKIIEIFFSEGVIHPNSRACQKAIIFSVENNRANILAALLKHGGNSNHVLDSGLSLLDCAVIRDHFDCVKVLIENGANINYQDDQEGFTALHFAVKENRIDIARYLLNNGANCSLFTKNMNTPLHTLLIVIANHPDLYTDKDKNEMFNLIFRYTDNINALSKEGTALFHAAMTGYYEAVVILLKHGADVNLPDKEGITPLHIAALFGHSKIVVELLKYNADIHTRGKYDGHTPLRDAVILDHIEVTILLIKHGADTNVKDSRGTTPLWLAANRGFIRELNELIKAGAKVDTQTLSRKSELLEVAENKPQHVKDNIEKYFKELGKDEAVIDAYTVAKLSGNDEAAELIQSKLREIEPTYKKMRQE